jgi:predicted AlkP superfamily pyrophosphatase or phosphodiesterase
MEDIGISAYDDDYPFETVFSKNNIKRYIHTNYGSDANAFDKLCVDLEEGSEPKHCFLAMAEFDHIMHKYGMKSDEYYAEIRNVDAKLSKLWGVLEKRNNSPELLLISDHGMTPVSEGIKFNIEESISGFQKDYFYFIDATMARIWIVNDKKCDEIKDWLEGSNIPGMILNIETREKWGITSKKFGDIIFLLDDGKMFIPNFIGDLGCKAMHGYLPNHKTQLGIIASTKKLNNDAEVVLANDVYTTLESFLD